jgi:hypothetical protein
VFIEYVGIISPINQSRKIRARFAQEIIKAKPTSSRRGFSAQEFTNRPQRVLQNQCWLKVAHLEAVAAATLIRRGEFEVVAEFVRLSASDHWHVPLNRWNERDWNLVGKTEIKNPTSLPDVVSGQHAVDREYIPIRFGDFRRLNDVFKHPFALSNAYSQHFRVLSCRACVQAYHHLISVPWHSRSLIQDDGVSVDANGPESDLPSQFENFPNVRFKSGFSTSDVERRSYFCKTSKNGFDPI